MSCNSEGICSVLNRGEEGKNMDFDGKTLILKARCTASGKEIVFRDGDLKGDLS